MNRLLISPLTTTCAHQGCHTLCTGHLRLSALLPACTATHKKQATLKKTSEEFRKTSKIMLKSSCAFEKPPYKLGQNYIKVQKNLIFEDYM